MSIWRSTCLVLTGSVVQVQVSRSSPSPGPIPGPGSVQRSFNASQKSTSLLQFVFGFLFFWFFGFLSSFLFDIAKDFCCVQLWCKTSKNTFHFVKLQKFRYRSDTKSLRNDGKRCTPCICKTCKISAILGPMISWPPRPTASLAIMVIKEQYNN
jgi:hypothetical protein